jgi:cytochrome P450
VSAMTSFFLLMSLYPDVQKRAQAEVDQVVGRDRLPTLDDQNALVYISALIKEVIRWGPVAPLGAQLL